MRISGWTKTCYYHNDHLATPQKMTDSTGAVVWSADYKPFGEATVTVSTITNNLRFPGQYYDVETGLHYNYFRDYNPAIGRYIEKDPIGLLGGVNLYAYVGNKPTVFLDQYGLQTVPARILALIAQGNLTEALVIAEAAGFGIAPRIQQTINTINSLMQRYPRTSLQCDKLAQKTYETFRSIDANPEIIKIVDQAGARYFIDSQGNTFATSGFHQASISGSRLVI